MTINDNFDGGPGAESGGYIYRIYRTDDQSGELSVMVDRMGAPYLATLAAFDGDGIPECIVFDLRQQHGQWHLRLDGNEGVQEIPMPATVAQFGWTASPRGTLQEAVMTMPGVGVLGAVTGMVVDTVIDAVTGSKPSKTRPEAGALPLGSVPPEEPGWYLTVKNGESVNTRFLIHTATVIGRSQDADISLNDVGISHRHAQISVTEEGLCWIADLKSRNGTMVNGERITASVWLNAGDMITLGETMLTLSKES